MEITLPPEDQIVLPQSAVEDDHVAAHPLDHRPDRRDPDAARDQQDPGSTLAVRGEQSVWSFEADGRARMQTM